MLLKTTLFSGCHNGVGRKLILGRGREETKFSAAPFTLDFFILYDDPNDITCATSGTSTRASQELKITILYGNLRKNRPKLNFVD